MKRFFFVGLALGAALASAPAFAQSGTNILPGQMPAAMSQSVFNANTDAAGFSEQSMFNGLAAAGTTQATATLVPTRVVLLTTCAGGAGILLPSVTRYIPITVINRSGGSCLVYPSLGATVETALGTNGATNAPATMATNTDTIFRPVSATSWVQ